MTNLEPNQPEKKRNIREWAWMPWLPFVLIGFAMIWAGDSYTGFIIPFVFVAPLSFFIGGIVYIFFRKDAKGKDIVVLVFFVVPFLAVMANIGASDSRRTKAKKSEALLQEYCSKYANSEIYQTVSGVKGVMQMDFRKDYSLQYAKKEEVPDPWFQMETYFLRPGETFLSRTGYYFFERKSVHESELPNIERFYLHLPRKAKNESEFSDIKELKARLESKVVSVETPKSRYGWRSTDHTSPKMRKYWLSGGTIQIIDLETNTVLGEITNYFVGAGAYKRRSSWYRSSNAGGGCEGIPRFSNLLRQVLVPVEHQSLSDVFETIDWIETPEK